MLYLFDERSQHSKPTHFWKVQNENCWFMRLLESLDRIISSFEIGTQCRQSVIIMYQKLRRWESKSSLLNAKMEVTVFENLINQQFSFCSFQKYIGLLCCDLSSKRYNIFKMIKKWLINANSNFYVKDHELSFRCGLNCRFSRPHGADLPLRA